MPFYRFITRHGTKTTEGYAIELENTREAWKEATLAAGEILKEIDGSLEPNCEWRMDVSDDVGNTLFSLRVIPETYVPRTLLKPRV